RVSFRSGPKSPVENGLLIFAGGNLEGRKGVAIVLHALVKLRNDGVPFRFVYGGQGPEYSSLCGLAKSLGFEEAAVSLGTIFSFDQYRKQLQESHIYLLPSLRESAGLTLAEAMLSGCVPVVASCGGPAMLVTENCGFALPPSNPEDLAQGIADVLTQLWKSPDLLQRLSHTAVQRVKTYASEEAYLAGICEAYAAALHFRLH
ncbi:MAG: glycosyltransferase family 4 protein, partial [Terrimicrobiaceae bacterium]